MVKINWDMYNLEKRRLVKVSIAGWEATEIAHRYVVNEESKERRLLKKYNI